MAHVIRHRPARRPSPQAGWLTGKATERSVKSLCVLYFVIHSHITHLVSPTEIMLPGAPLHPALAPHWLVAAPRCRVAVLEAVATAPRRMPRHSAPRLPAPSLRPTPQRWACGRCLTAATRPLLRSGYSRWSGAIIASRSVRRAELRRDARGLPAGPFGRAGEHFFCTDPVWPESVAAARVRDEASHER